MTVCRGRFAPSPSGYMHLGNAWTALLAWLQVRQLGGKMVLRIEDLDPQRSKQLYVDQIMDDLQWLGLDWDEGPDVGGPHGPYRQSARRALYEQALHRLEQQGLVYRCFCTRRERHEAALAPHAGEEGPAYDGRCRRITLAQQRELVAAGRPFALRLRVPPGTVEVHDMCRGVYRQDVARTVGDFIVRRADGVHAYQLAVVVDDAAMGITHVLRGDDLLPSTPRQLALYHFLGLLSPTFTHVPLLCGPDGARLSKRHAALALAQLRRAGVTADAVVGYLGWLAGLLPRPQRVRPQDLVGVFDVAKLPVGPLVINDFPSWPKGE